MSIEWLPGWGMTAAAFDPLREALGDHRSAWRVAVGWSLGGQEALERARRAPSTVDRLVLIGTTPCFVQRDDWPHAMPQTVFDDFAASLRRDRAATLERFVSLQAQGEENPRAVIRALRRAVSPNGADVLAGDLATLGTRDLRDALPAIDCEVLVIHGERDSLVPPAAATFLAENLRETRCAIVPRAGHAPFVSQPEFVAALISEFLDG